MREAPLLSVCLITYNHAKYIRQAIESVLMQQVNFTWELIIADDYSTDGTREIVLEYYNRYPDFIRLILQEKNVGPARNWLDLITTPQSKYIAYLEGDDCWIDPLKLQKQVDFLESFADVNLCTTNGFVLDNLGNKSIYFGYSQFFFLHDLLKGNYVLSSTVVLRRNCITSEILNLLTKFHVTDWPLWTMILEKSDARGYNLNIFAVQYNYHGNGLASSKNFLDNTLRRLKDRYTMLKIISSNKDSLILKNYLVERISTCIKRSFTNRSYFLLIVNNYSFFLSVTFYILFLKLKSNLFFILKGLKS